MKYRKCLATVVLSVLLSISVQTAATTDQIQRDAEDNVCLGQPNGSFLVHPLGCKYFIVCNNGNINTGTCGVGMAFNPAKPPCDNAANVNCLEDLITNPSTTTTTESPTTTTTTTTAEVTTEPTTTTTTTTTTRPTTTTTTTSTLTTTTTTIMPSTLSTTTTTARPTTTTTTTARPTTTTSSTARPTTKTTTTRPTTTTTTLRPTTTTPLTPSKPLYPSSTTKSTTTKPEVTSKPPPTIIDPTVESDITCPSVENPDEILFIPSNIDCSRFYICYHNRPMSMYCSKNLHWNIETNKCDSMANAKCTVSTMPSFFPVCPRDAEVFYAHPFNCGWFLYCNRGHMTVQQCDFFYNWDTVTESCQIKTKAKCNLFKF